jgi:hypothetical protein
MSTKFNFKLVALYTILSAMLVVPAMGQGKDETEELKKSREMKTEGQLQPQKKEKVKTMGQVEQKKEKEKTEGQVEPQKKDKLKTRGQVE